MIKTLAGENDVLRQEALRQIIDSFVTEHGDMGLERLDGQEAEYARMHEAVQGMPFLSSRKLVVLRAPGSNKDFTEHFEEFITDVAETNDVIIVEPKLDKRLSYYKLLKKSTDFQDFPVLDVNGLMRYLSGYASRQGGTLTMSDARVLIDRVGLNQLTLQHEVDKLLAHDTTINRSSIELLTERTPQSSIFELLEAAFAGNTQRAMALYREQRAARVEPQEIFAMLVWQLHRLAVVKMAGTRSSQAIASDLHTKPYPVEKTQQLARRISLAQLKQYVRELREFDVRLKSQSLSADEVVQYYLLHIAA
jgi:DNA polymerase III delta subunit